MKLAAGDFVWLIVVAVFAIAKMWSKFATSQSEDDDGPTPPTTPPRPRPQVRPVIKPVTQTKWEVAPKDLREFMQQLTRPPQPKPAPPPIAPPPVPKPAAPPPAPVAAKAAPEPPRRSSPWVAALRDRQNLRNIIIANEIIGPPRGA
jgi:hypothetical protein